MSLQSFGSNPVILLERHPRWLNRLARAGERSELWRWIGPESLEWRDQSPAARAGIWVIVWQDITPEFVAGLPVLLAAPAAGVIVIGDLDWEHELQLRELGIAALLPEDTTVEELVRTVRRLQSREIVPVAPGTGSITVQVPEGFQNSES